MAMEGLTGRAGGKEGGASSSSGGKARLNEILPNPRHQQLELVLYTHALPASYSCAAPNQAGTALAKCQILLTVGSTIVESRFVHVSAPPRACAPASRRLRAVTASCPLFPIGGGRGVTASRLLVRKRALTSA
jgi:hypothetical protein